MAPGICDGLNCVWKFLIAIRRKLSDPSNPDTLGTIPGVLFSKVK